MDLYSGLWYISIDIKMRPYMIKVLFVCYPGRCGVRVMENSKDGKKSVSLLSGYVQRC